MATVVVVGEGFAVLVHGLVLLGVHGLLGGVGRLAALVHAFYGEAYIIRSLGGSGLGTGVDARELIVYGECRFLGSGLLLGDFRRLMEEPHGLLVKVGPVVLFGLGRGFRLGLICLVHQRCHLRRQLHTLLLLLLVLTLGGGHLYLVLHLLGKPFDVHLRQLHLVHQHKEEHRQEEQHHQRPPAQQAVQRLGHQQAYAGVVLEALALHPRTADVAQRERAPEHPEQRAAESLPPRHHHHAPQPHAVDEEQQREAEAADAEEVDGEELRHLLAQRARPSAAGVGDVEAYHGYHQKDGEQHVDRAADVREALAAQERYESRRAALARGSLAFPFRIFLTLAHLSLNTYHLTLHT